MATIGIIPARGGSKGIHKKCITPCNGKPLIYYTIEAAKKSKLLDYFFVSTDDKEIAEVSKQLGTEVPFMRPKELAQDDTPMTAVLQNCVTELKNSEYNPTEIVLLQPTSPLRTSEHIDEAISKFNDSNAEVLVSVIEVPHQFTPESLMVMQNNNIHSYKKDDKIITRRQDKPTLYARNGPAIYITKINNILNETLYTDNTVPYIMKESESVDIDTEDNIKLAEYYLRYEEK